MFKLIVPLAVVVVLATGDRVSAQQRPHTMRPSGQFAPTQKPYYAPYNPGFVTNRGFVPNSVFVPPAISGSSGLFQPASYRSSFFFPPTYFSSTFFPTRLSFGSAWKLRCTSRTADHSIVPPSLEGRRNLREAVAAEAV